VNTVGEESVTDLQEHRLLRAEILELSKEMRFLQRMFAIGVGVYVAGLMSESAADPTWT
jgi:hypothetical protein